MSRTRAVDKNVRIDRTVSGADSLRTSNEVGWDSGDWHQDRAAHGPKSRSRHATVLYCPTVVRTRKGAVFGPKSGWPLRKATILRAWRTWLRPGMSVKRWALLILMGSALTGVAVAMALVYTYRYYTFPEPLAEIISGLTLQFLPRPARFLMVLALGALAVAIGFWKLGTSLVSPFLRPSDRGRELADILADHRFGTADQRLRVVAIGGGTGLSSLLRGLKQYNIDITAIVTVADDGGSTGRIRSEFDIPAPGDIRNCLAALADDESLVSRLFQYRFDQEGSDLRGHSLGNLFITALTQVTGSFEQAVSETASVLNIRGRVLPSTVANVHLGAELTDGSTVIGESVVAYQHAPIRRVFLAPDDVPVYEPAFGAILSADLIVIGPGSLYTSVMPNLLIEGITKAIRWSPGRTVYVCNVATQPGETDHYDAADHLHVVVEQLGEGAVDDMLVNNNPATAASIKPEDPITAVGVADLGDSAFGVRIRESDLVSAQKPLRHEPHKLAKALMELANEPRAPRTGAGSAPKSTVPPRARVTA